MFQSTGSEIEVEVVRSQRRRRTAEARLDGDKLVVMVPATLDAEQEREVVDDLVNRTKRRLASQPIDLEARARHLAKRYDLPAPERIEWSSRQMKRWGSCSPHKGAIRISNRLASTPQWVLDAVIIHELAHLVEANHGPRFQLLVNRYELAERARGYLIAKDEEP